MIEVLNLNESTLISINDKNLKEVLCFVCYPTMND